MINRFESIAIPLEEIAKAATEVTGKQHYVSNGPGNRFIISIPPTSYDLLNSIQTSNCVWWPDFEFHSVRPFLMSAEDCRSQAMQMAEWINAALVKGSALYHHSTFFLVEKFLRAFHAQSIPDLIALVLELKSLKAR